MAFIALTSQSSKFRLHSYSGVDSFIFSVNSYTNRDWAFPFLILVVATDMEKNLKGVLFHFRFGFSVIIGRLSRLDAMITSLTSFPIGRIQVKLEPYQQLR